MASVVRGRLVLLGLGLVTAGAGPVGEHQRLAGHALQLLDLGHLPGQLHLELALVADDSRRLLDERLVLALRVLDGLLDLHLRVGVLVDLRAEERHQVMPALDERVRHLRRIPSMSLSRTRHRRGSAGARRRRELHRVSSDATGVSVLRGISGSSPGIPRIDPTRRRGYRRRWRATA